MGARKRRRRPKAGAMRRFHLCGVGQIRFDGRVNGSERAAADRFPPLYSILGYAPLIRPDVAVNEFRQASSQRFGRDSFQTRSTA
jgi:hypothetical protein